MTKPPKKKKLGLIVNPVAGIGGRVGLKGSDGRKIQKRALKLGAVLEAPDRAAESLKKLKLLVDRLEVLTWAGAMGEDSAAVAGFRPIIVGASNEKVTSADDTEQAARRLAAMEVDLILFAGGDGTARNIYHAVGGGAPVLGVPAGVKIHSSVYTNTPADAGTLAGQYLDRKGRTSLREVEVMDIDEDAFRENRVSAKLYGYLRAPYAKSLIQGAKAGSQSSDEAIMHAIASDIITNMDEEHLYIIGSGTTTRAIMNLLGLPNTLLGVDAVLQKCLVGSDLNEQALLDLVQDTPAKIVITVIGGQGHIFGRGNQQISPRVIRAVGKENIIIVASEDKIIGLNGKLLVADTGDSELSREISGYVKVVTGLHKRIVYRISG